MTEGTIDMTLLKNNISALLTAMLLSSFCVVGYSFQETDSFHLIFGSEESNPALAAVTFLVLWGLLFIAIVYLFKGMDSWNKELMSGQRNETVLIRHPFAISFMILIVAYIPYTVLSYPAIFLADESMELLEWHPELGVYFPIYLEGHLVKEGVMLNTHMPLFHTVLLNTVFNIGFALFGSANKAIFLYSVLQELGTFAVLAAFISFGVKEWNFPGFMVVACLLYYICSPRIQNYMMVTTKDVFYADCLILFLMFSWKVMFHEKTWGNLVGFALSALGLFLLRNDGRYILVFALVLSLAAGRRHWKKVALIATGATIVLAILLDSILLPALSVTPGSRREMLSVPFQQTARYVKNYPEDVTAEEAAAIDKILDYKRLAKKYDNGRADRVKDTFREEATNEELIQYFKVWWQMFRKHPLVYVASFINNYYQYFFPSVYSMRIRGYDFSTDQFAWLSNHMKPLGIHFSYPKSLETYRNRYEFYRESKRWEPLVNAATYDWMLILAIAYSISRKRRQAIIMLAYPLGVLLVCCLSPCNGFFCRYTYPLMMALPVFFLGAMNTPVFQKETVKKE